MDGSAYDTTALAIRLALGSFYFLNRYRFYYDQSRKISVLNPQRSESLTSKMVECGWDRAPRFWAHFTAFVEVFGGLALIVGLLSRAASLGILAVTLVATWCTAKDKVMKQGPVDKVDCVGCYFWCVEPHLAMMAIILLAFGPGAYSIDSLLGIP